MSSREIYRTIAVVIEAKQSSVSMENWLRAVFEGREEIPQRALFGTSPISEIIIEVKQYLDDNTQRRLIETVRHMFRLWMVSRVSLQASVAIGVIQLVAKLELIELKSSLVWLNDDNTIDSEIRKAINEAIEQLEK